MRGTLPHGEQSHRKLATVPDQPLMRSTSAGWHRLALASLNALPSRVPQSTLEYTVRRTVAVVGRAQDQ